MKAIFFRLKACLPRFAARAGSGYQRFRDRNGAQKPIDLGGELWLELADLCDR